MKTQFMSTQICAVLVFIVTVSTFLTTYLQLNPRQLISRSSSTTSSTNSPILPDDDPVRQAIGDGLQQLDSNNNSSSAHAVAVNTTISIDDDNNSSSTNITNNNNNNTIPLIPASSLTARKLTKHCTTALREFYTEAQQFTLRQPFPSSSSTTNDHDMAQLLPSRLRSYIQWHQSERTCLVSNHTHCNGDIPRVLVWRCYTILCGGVGDRMRGIRFMFLLAMSTNRLFFIDWPIRAASPYPLTAALLPAWVDWRVPVKALKHLERRSSNVNSVNIVSGENMRRRGRKKKKSGGHRRRASHRNETEIVSISPNGTDFINDSPWKEADVIYITNRMSRSALHDLCENPILQHTLVSSLKRSILPLVRLERILMHVLFAPTAVVSSLAAARSPPINQDGGYIAAHARTGVDLGEGKGPRLGYIASHLKEAAQRLYRCTRDIQQNSLSQQRVFLASDSHELKEHFIALARNEDVDVFTEERRPLHIDREGTMRNVNRDSGHNMCLAFLDVFADIFALAQADAFVYFHSGFAATAESFGKLHRPVPVHEIDLGSDEEGGDVPLQHEGECIPTEEDLYKDEKMRRPLD